MLKEKLNWRPKITKASGPKDVLLKQVEALRKMQPELGPALTTERRGENHQDGSPTLRIELTVNLNGRQKEVATVQYPQDAPGHPALVITGDAPLLALQLRLRPRRIT